MSRTKHNSKGSGYDYWSRRHPSNGCNGYGPDIKKMTHGYERRKGKQESYLEVEKYR